LGKWYGVNGTCLGKNSGGGKKESKKQYRRGYPIEKKEKVGENSRDNSSTQESMWKKE